jgi:hypothetical protein
MNHFLTLILVSFMTERRKLIINLIVLTILCMVTIKCDSTEPSTQTNNVVKGTLTMPAPAPGKEVFVLVDNDIDGANGYLHIRSDSLGQGTTQEYSFSNIPPGAYYIYSIVTIVSDSLGLPMTGDYFGIYGGTTANPPANPNATIPNEGTVVFDITLSEY